MNNIHEKLQKHYNKVIEYGIPKEQILGIFLYGSQNYNCATEESDVDTKAIIIPTYHDLCCGRPISVELSLDNGEHCEVKDIREMVKMWKKQNINFLEILFTKYYIINDLYKDMWQYYFIGKRDIITQYDINAAVRSMVGQALHTIKQNPNNCKKIANGWRFNLFLTKMFSAVNYGDYIYLSESERETFLDIKTGKITIDTDLLLESIINNGDLVIQKYGYNAYFSKKYIDEDIFNQGIINLCRCLEFIG